MNAPRLPTRTTRQRLAATLRFLAIAGLLAGLVFWWAKGAHTGWSMHRVPSKQTDEVTGIEFVTYEERYVPGVDFLGLLAGAGVALLAVSFFIQRKTLQPPS